MTDTPMDDLPDYRIGSRALARELRAAVPQSPDPGVVDARTELADWFDIIARLEPRAALDELVSRCQRPPDPPEPAL